MPKRWTFDDIPNLSGKTIIVTGANTGLGYASVEEFAKKGAKVILACRTVSKGAKAKKEISSRYEKSKIEVMELDLADLSSVRRFTESFKKNYQRLDVLLNNAGVMMCPEMKTKDGFEMQNGTNHFGHFALTGLLFDMLKKTPGSRVVSISSVGHRFFGSMDYDNFMFEKGGYTPSKAYGRSKLANLLFTYELQRKIEKAELNMISAAAHPGGSNTELSRHLGSGGFSGWFMKRFGQSARMGALPGILASVDPSVKGSDYYGPRGFMEISGYPKKVKSNANSHNLEYATWLWETSEKLTGVKFDFSK